MHPSIVRRRSSTVRWILSLLSPEPTTTGLPSVSTKATNGSGSAEFTKVSTFFRSVMDDRNLGSGYHRPWGRSSRESQTPVQESPTAKGTRRLKSSCSKTERNPNDTLLAGGGCPDVAEEGRAPMLCSIRTCRNRKTPPAGVRNKRGGSPLSPAGDGEIAKLPLPGGACFLSGVPVYARDRLPRSLGGEERGGFGYAWSKSDLDIPRSLLIWWRVPVARSRLPCLGMIALRPLAGFTHISWDPSAWRRNLQPRDSSFVRSSL